MARLALTVAGGVIGGLLGGPLGFALGSSLGGIVGNLLFPQKVAGPRLTDLQVASAANGAPIAFGWGTFRLGGQIIFADKIQEHSSSNSLKGGPSQTTYSYTCTFAVSFGKGPGQILQVWADTKCIYDVTGGQNPGAPFVGSYNSSDSYSLGDVVQDGSNYYQAFQDVPAGSTYAPTAELGINYWAQCNAPNQQGSPVAQGTAFTPTLYSGTQTQGQDPVLVSFTGANATPAYRGQIYAVFENFPLDKYGNRVPNMRGTVSYGNPELAFPVTPLAQTNAPQGLIFDSQGQMLYVQQGSGSTMPFNKLNVLSGEELLSGTDVVPIQPPATYTGPPVQYRNNTPGNALAACVGADGTIYGFADGTGDGGFGYALDPNTLQDFVTYPFTDSQPYNYNSSNMPSAINSYLPGDGSTFMAFVWSGAMTVFKDGLTKVGWYGWGIPPGAVSPVSTPVTGPQNITFTTYFPVWGGTTVYFIGYYEDVGASVYQWYIYKINTVGGVDIHGQFTDVTVWTFNSTSSVGVGTHMVYNPSNDTLVCYTDKGAFVVVDATNGTIIDTVGSASSPVFSTSNNMIGPTSCMYATEGQVIDGIVYAADHTVSGQLNALRVSDFSIVNSYSFPNSWVSGTSLSNVNDWKVNPLDDSIIASVPTTGTKNVYRLYLDRPSQTGFAIGDMLTDICTLAGIDPAVVDVSQMSGLSCLGYVVTSPQDAKSVIQPLQQAFFFDAVESDFTLKFIPRGGASAVTIDEDDLGLQDDKKKITETISQEIDLPKNVSVTYVDPALDYQSGKQQRIRHSKTTKTVNQTMLNLPLVMNETEALQIADKYMWLAELERTSYDFNMWKALHMLIDPTDVVTFTYEGLEFVARVVSSNIGANFAVEISGVSQNANAYLSQVMGVGQQGFNKGGVSPFGPTILFVMDIPLLRDVDASPSGNSGYYFAMASPVSGWQGGVLYISTDDETWSQTGAATGQIAYGSVPAALGAPPRSPWVWDAVNTITVYMAGGGVPQSTTKTAVLNGANCVILGKEIIQYQNATLNSDGSYTLSMLLRGRRGTESACGSHVAGEKALFPQLLGNLYRNSASASLVGLLRYVKAITNGADQNSQAGSAFTLQGNDLKPYAPAHLKGARDGSNNLTLTWVRRTRIGGQGVMAGVVPLSETSESYDVEIMNGGTVVRTFSALTSPTVTYTATEQVTDFGSTQSSVTFNVYQRSGYLPSTNARGFKATATV